MEYILYIIIGVMAATIAMFLMNPTSDDDYMLCAAFGFFGLCFCFIWQLRLCFV